MTLLRAVLPAAAIGLAACSTTPDPRAGAQQRLDALILSQDAPRNAVAGAAIAIWSDGEIIWSGAAGHAAFDPQGVSGVRPMSAQTPVRAASVSKLAVALTAHALAEAGVVDLDAPLEPLLGFDLPVPTLSSVTLRSALAHTSGLCDPPVYWAPLGLPLSELMGPGAMCDRAPEAGWTYANINYALVAQALENATQERFDRLASRLVLDRLGLDTGFNWSGVSAERRASGATLYRREAGAWIAQTDDASVLAGDTPAILRHPDYALIEYEPGTNGTLFSPQGGLRADAEDLARLAAAFLPGAMGAPLAQPVWSGEVSPGVRAWGSGPQILLPGQLAHRPALELVGHSGEAYGLFAGAWAVPSHNAAIAFYVNGTDRNADTARGEVSGLTRWEAELLDLGLDILDAESGRDIP